MAEGDLNAPSLAKPVVLELNILPSASPEHTRPGEFAHGMDSVMPAPKSSGSNPATELRAWEPPTLVEFKIGAETKSNRGRRPAPEPTEPAPSPAAPMTKLGFSLEWAFPLSSRVEK